MSPKTPSLNKAQKVVSTRSEPSKGNSIKTSQIANKRQIIGMRKKGGSEEQQKWIQYAFARCGVECILTWEAESGWIHKRPGNKPNKNGTVDKGLCQLNSKYHSSFLKSKESNDPYKVLDYCVSVWKDAMKRPYATSCGKTPWCGYNVINVRPGVRDRFDFIYK